MKGPDAAASAQQQPPPPPPPLVETKVQALKRKRHEVPLLALLPAPLEACPPSRPALKALASGLASAGQAPPDLPRRADATLPLEELLSTKRWARPLLGGVLSATLGILQVPEAFNR
jgi:hypothetical protein